MFISSAAVSIPPRSIRLHSPLVESAQCPALSSASARIIPATLPAPTLPDTRIGRTEVALRGIRECARPWDTSNYGAVRFPSAPPFHALKPPGYRLPHYQPEDQQAAHGPAESAIKSLGSISREGGALGLVEILDQGITHMEPLVTGHAAHWPQADCRHKPVQACAVGPIKCMAFAARAGKRGR